MASTITSGTCPIFSLTGAAFLVEGEIHELVKKDEERGFVGASDLEPFGLLLDKDNSEDLDVFFFESIGFVGIGINGNWGLQKLKSLKVSSTTAKSNVEFVTLMTIESLVFWIFDLIVSVPWEILLIN